MTLQQLSAHLDDALQGASLQTVERHLANCEACRDELAALTMQDDVLSAVLRGESDDLIFELITLQVRCSIHPQKARELQKQVKTIELALAENRLRAETQALREADTRRAGLDNLERGLGDAAVPTAPDAAPAPPTSGFEASDSRGGSVGNQRRVLEEEQARAEAEARALGLEARRAGDEAERLALEAAGERARGGREARRRREQEEARTKGEDEARRSAAEEARLRAEAELRIRTKVEARARLVAAARAEAETLAAAAASALAEAESSAREAVFARERAEAHAAAADVAQREAEFKADEASRLAAGPPGPTESPRGAPALPAAGPHPVRHAQDAEDDLFLPATLGLRGAVASPRGPRHAGARRHPRSPRRRSSFPLAAAAGVLLAAFGGWFLIQHRDLFGVLHPALNVDAVVRPDAAPAPPAARAEDGGAASQDNPGESPTGSPAAVVSTEGRPSAQPTPAHRPAAVAKMDETAAGEESGHVTAAPVTRRKLVAVTPSAPATGLQCGDVRDELGRPVAGARVLVADAGLSVVTDRGGRFCFAIPNGAHVLSVLAIGFHTQRHDVMIGRQTSDLVFTLHIASPAAGDSIH